MKHLPVSLIAATLIASGAPAKPVTVNPYNFARAETDTYMARFVKSSGLGKFEHIRTPTPIDRQDVIRMNRDTIYSSAVFDLDAGPVTITLPDAGKRFMSALVINQDHYALQTAYAPATVTITREQAGTRYAVVLLRTFVNANDPADIKAANAAQDAVRISERPDGAFEIPEWDPATHKKTRDALLALAALGGPDSVERFGKPGEVDPIAWLIATAAGWGGNPRKDAVYVAGFAPSNDEKAAYRLRVKDVPVDGFWSVTMYNAEGFMYENPQKAYALNNVTAKPDADGGFTIQFGGDPATAANYLPTTPGWNYLVRLYRPRQAILDGSWRFPSLEPLPGK